MFKNHANNIKIQQYYYFLEEEKEYLQYIKR